MVRLARTRTRLENRFVLRALSEGDRSHPDTCVSRQPGWVGTGDERLGVVQFETLRYHCEAPLLR
jgi:hypothetical protein